MSFKGRVAVITGGGSGIGRATALKFAGDGARIAVVGRTEEELQEAVDEIQQAGGEGLVAVADISEPDEMKSVMDRIVSQWGRIDTVFANAGVNGTWARIEDLEIDEWDQTISINLSGTFYTLKYAVPHLKKQGGSIIINSSVNGTRVFSNTGATAYASTKAAQVAMAKMLALELAGSGVRVNVICPGAIETSIEDNTEQRDTEEMGVPVEFPEGWHPLRGEPGSSEDVADLVYFLASDAARHITGTELWIDGGESLIGIKG
jgi:NAD(P)-dependent dehydrogenase (short-subunit alcohol dehydrogenase family)